MEYRAGRFRGQIWRDQLSGVPFVGERLARAVPRLFLCLCFSTSSFIGGVAATLPAGAVARSGIPQFEVLEIGLESIKLCEQCIQPRQQELVRRPGRLAPALSQAALN